MTQLKCVACGAKLDVTDDIEIFACSYCGNQQLVERQLGAVVVDHATEPLRSAHFGTDKVAAELALRRLVVEAEELKRFYQRLMRKREKRKEAFNLVSGIVVAVSLLVGVAIVAILRDQVYTSSGTEFVAFLPTIALGMLVLWFGVRPKYKRNIAEDGVQLEQTMALMESIHEQIVFNRSIVS